MSQLRVEKVQEFIKQEVGKMLVTGEIKDPRIGFVTVTHVEVTGDLSTATIYISLYGSDDQKAATWTGLQSALGFMRSEISKRIRLRVAPELVLRLDESLNYSARIQELLQQIKEEEKKS
ncbi:MAG: rbfA [Firmicutes bacterium]|nr:rbfA [Bacillota bacterium]